MAILVLTGPSPPVRGKRNCANERGSTGRSIPARAGEALPAGICMPLQWVHPRPCGGSKMRHRNPKYRNGPSPPVRGKPFLNGNDRRRNRSIPARAGEADVDEVKVIMPKVHPRPCGGSPDNPAVSVSLWGPSPPVRGKPDCVCAVDVPLRSIPARAGEASKRTVSPTLAPVHPRPCGGSAFVNASANSVTGPSPPVRGKLRCTQGRATP